MVEATLNACPPSALSAPTSFRLGTSASVLGEVRRPELDVAVWRREVPPVVASVLRAWVPDTGASPFDREVTAAAAAIDEAVSPAPPPIQHALAADVAHAGMRRFVLIATAGGPWP